VSALLGEAAKKEPPKDEFGRVVMRLPKFYTIAGSVAALAGLGFLIYGLSHFDRNDIDFIFLSAAMAFGFAFSLLSGGLRLEMRFNDYEIFKRTALGKERTMHWAEVTEIKYSKRSRELILIGNSGKIRCHIHMKGFPALLLTIYQKYNLTGWDLDIPQYLNYPVKRP
jgi:hypothetical protein